MTHTHDWLDDIAPLPDDDAALQLESLEALLSPEPRRVLDLGCGAGRVLVPMGGLGHRVVGLDRSAAALGACRLAVDAAGIDGVELVEADFAEPWPDLGGPFDAVLCLGNTFMAVHDVDDAVALLAQAAAHLRPQGVFVIDDIPGWYWPELAEGHWSAGTSEDDRWQLVWAADDAVFTMRRDEAVNEDDWTLGDDERRFRLWTIGALRLALRASGLSAEPPQRWGGLLVVRRGAGARVPD